MRRPWNRVDLPVYSVSSFDGRDAINICTWAFPTSIKPKRYTIALDRSSFTHEVVLSSQRLILQFLSVEHIGLIDTLGKRSMRTTDKLHGLTTSRVDGIAILDGLRAFVMLSVESVHPSGDHDLFICSVVRSKNLSDEPALTTRHLIDSNIIL